MMGPIRMVPQGQGLELRWSILEQFIGNAYVYFGLAFLLHNAVLWWSARRRTAQPTTDGDATPEAAMTASIP